MSVDPTHLGDRLSALVDGELDHDTRDRMLAHLAGCAECRADVDDERRLKAQLSGLPDPVMPAGLVEQLYAVPTTGAPETEQRRDVSVASSRVTAPAAGRPDARRDSRRPGSRDDKRSRARRNKFVAAGTGGLLASAMGLAFIIGGGAASGQAVTPAVEQLTVEHAAVTTDVPLTGPANPAVTASFARSEQP